jgi:hypothetical protein
MITTLHTLSLASNQTLSPPSLHPDPKLRLQQRCAPAAREKLGHRPPLCPWSTVRRPHAVRGDAPIQSGFRESASPSASWSSRPRSRTTCPDCRSPPNFMHLAQPLRVRLVIRIVLPQSAVAGSICNTSRCMPQPSTYLSIDHLTSAVQVPP